MANFCSSPVFAIGDWNSRVCNNPAYNEGDVIYESVMDTLTGPLE